MSNNQPSKQFNLEDRTQVFARDVRRFVIKLAKTIASQEDGRQLIRSSGSVGANYIEANDALGKKDFLMRMRISRKEAKESRFWLSLFENLPPEQEKERARLEGEAMELVKIMSAIILKV